MLQHHTQYSTIKNTEEEPKEDITEFSTNNYDNSKQELKKEKQDFSFNSIKGMMYLATANIFLGISSLLVSYAYHIDPYLFPMDVIVIINFFPALLSFINMKYHGIKIFDIPQHERKSLFGRTFSVMSATFSYYIAFKTLTLSIAAVLLNTAPLITILLGYIMLKEKLSYYDILGSISAFFGVIFIVQPGFLGFSKNTYTFNGSYYEVIGIVAILTSAFSLAISNIYSRKLKETNPIYQVFYPTFFGTIISFILSLIYHVVYESMPAITITALIILIASASFSTFSRLTTSIGFSLEKAGRGAAVQFFQPVIGVIGDIVTFGHVLNVWEIIGTVMIVGFSFVLFLLKALKVTV